MNSELATIPPAQLAQVQVQPSFADLERAAKYAAESGVFGQLTVAQAMTMFLTAQAEGIHPMRALKIYDVIKGKAALKPAIMLARYQAAGGRIRYIERSNTRCEIEFTHPAADSLIVAWTIEDARRIGLAGKDNWRNYPGPMLQWRCVAEGIRATCPGVLDGMYSTDEVQDFDNEPVGYAEAPMKFVEPPKNRHGFTDKQLAQIEAERAAIVAANDPPLDLPDGVRHIGEVLQGELPPADERDPFLPAPPLPEGIESGQVTGGNAYTVQRTQLGARLLLETASGPLIGFYPSLAKACDRSGMARPWEYKGTVTFRRVKERCEGQWDVDQLHFPELETQP